MQSRCKGLPWQCRRDGGRLWRAAGYRLARHVSAHDSCKVRKVNSDTTTTAWEIIAEDRQRTKNPKKRHVTSAVCNGQYLKGIGYQCLGPTETEGYSQCLPGRAHSLSSRCAYTVYKLSTTCLHPVYTLSTRCLHTVYTLSTSCLQPVYTLSRHCLHTVYTLSTHCLHTV